MFSEKDFWDFVGGKSGISKIIELAIEEDKARWDITSLTLLDNVPASGQIISKQRGIACGMYLITPVAEFFPAHIESFSLELIKRDGDPVKPGDTMAILHGPAYLLLAIERIVLNFIGFLSGIATHTARFVEKASRYGVKIRDTRKTIPAMRKLSKWAVRCGGGLNHRMDLYSEILIKENHITAAGNMEEVLRRVEKVKEANPQIPIEVEVKSVDELYEVIKSKFIDIIMLDNFPPESIKKAVEIIRQECNSGPCPKIEVSGGISLDNVEEVASSGIDFISVGAITHSAPFMDVAFYLSGRETH